MFEAKNLRNERGLKNLNLPLTPNSRLSLITDNLSPIPLEVVPNKGCDKSNSPSISSFKFNTFKRCFKYLILQNWLRRYRMHNTPFEF